MILKRSAGLVGVHGRAGFSTSRHRLIGSRFFTQGGDPVALLDLERNHETAAIACVVAPTHRRQGIAQEILQSLFALPEAEDLVEIVAEVEDGNVASQHLLCSGGFVFAARTEEGFERYVLRRPAQ